jgi:hypothetical protein
LLSPHQPLGVLHEQQQRVERLRRQRHNLAAPMQLALARRQIEVAEPVGALGGALNVL